MKKFFAKGFLNMPFYDYFRLLFVLKFSTHLIFLFFSASELSDLMPRHTQTHTHTHKHTKLPSFHTDNTASTFVGI